MIERPTEAEILQLSEGGSSSEALEWFRERARSSLYFFNKIILGYPDLTPGFHKPMCEWLEKDSHPQRGLLAPRKFFKSTCVKGYILRKLIPDTNQRFLFVGENDLVGSKNLTDIKWHITTNGLFRALYPHMIPSDYGKNWSDSAILIPRSRTFDEPTIQTVGIGAKHTGFHYTGIIYDDPIGLVAATSPAEMKRAIEWFQASEGLKSGPDSWELMVGTRWKHGKADLYGWIMKEMPYHLKPTPHGFDWYTRGAIENGEATFPERYPIYVLEAMRRKMKSYLFNANMMNNPTISEGTDFPETWIQTYTISEDRKEMILDDGEHVALKDVVRISVYDPAAGGKNADAESAVVVAGMDDHRRIFALEAWGKNCGFGRAIEQWHVYNDKWHPWRNWYEAVGAHKAVDEIMRMRSNPCSLCGKLHQKLRPYPIKPDDRSKEDRIRALAQPAFEEGRVYIGSHLTRLREQIEVFPHGELVDIFDAFAYAIAKLRPPAGSKREENERPKQDEYLHRGKAMSHTSWDMGGYG